MYSARRANKRNTVIIMMVFLLLIGGLGALAGYLYDDYFITGIVLFIAIIYALIEYFAASRMAISMAGGREIKKQDNPTLWNVVENLAIANGQPMPRVFIIDDPSPNAFATGRNPQHSYVAATTGLLQLMDKRELTGVMAHEMSHVKNYDIRVSMIVFGLVSAVAFISDFFMRMAWFGGDSDDDDNGSAMLIFGLVAAILAPIVAGLVQLAVSRQREYLADSSAALLTRDPEGLAMALRKLQANSRPMRRQNTAMAHLYINNPLRSGFFSRIFSKLPKQPKRVNWCRLVVVNNDYASDC